MREYLEGLHIRAQRDTLSHVRNHWRNAVKLMTDFIWNEENEVGQRQSDGPYFSRTRNPKSQATN
jgi:hypothetical protein